MEPWLAGTNSDHFTYDTTWGGLITTKATINLPCAFRSNLKQAMEPWLAGTNSDHFTYDTTWGGLITTKAMDDGGADFGQGCTS
jgi:Glycosyl hydrolase family 81 C-terminal domain